MYGSSKLDEKNCYKITRIFTNNYELTDVKEELSVLRYFYNYKLCDDDEELIDLKKEQTLEKLEDFYQ